MMSALKIICYALEWGYSYCWYSLAAPEALVILAHLVYLDPPELCHNAKLDFLGNVRTVEKM